ncbi:MAG: alpha/beta hydrolase [Candidatus Accumulibacter sp.]|nr:alpha/beta hydrolase [Accumulibacter sp.]
MVKHAHLQPSDLRGASRMVIDAIVGITDIVEAMHVNIAQLPGAQRPSSRRTARGVGGIVYRSVRLITGGIGHLLDAALACLPPPPDAKPSSVGREAALAAVNGVLGDYLEQTGNPLAMAMSLRREGRPLVLERNALAEASERPGRRLLLAVHGLCMNDLQWRNGTADPVAALAGELGCTALYLHYNSGRHISANGKEFADLLEILVEQWPVEVESLTIVAHSMGGLVTRSACHYAALAARRWPALLRQIVFIATPHHGAPLERGGNWIDLILGVSRYTAPLARLGKIRSAGITDLRYGNLVDEDWRGRDRFARVGDCRHNVPLPADTLCYAIAGTNGRGVGELGDRVLGDGLVQLDSALGRHAVQVRNLDFPASRQWIGVGVGHLALLQDNEVWQQIRRWLADPQAQAQSPASTARDGGG